MAETAELRQQRRFGFDPTLWDEFDEWAHTPQGRKVLDLAIKLCWGLHKRGVRIGAKAVWEKLRWHFVLTRAPGQRYKLNNNHTAYLARFIEARVPELKGFFVKRTLKENEE